MNRRPNILMITVDQQRFDCVGLDKKYPIQTPHIDQLANEGIRFTNAFTPIPMCCPARQALLHGKRPESFGSLWNYDFGLKTPYLVPAAYTWPRQLNESGYQTGYIGKWHVSPVDDPTSYGFDHYIGLHNYEEYRKRKYPWVTYENGWFGEKDKIPLVDSRTHWMVAETKKMMQELSESEAPWHIRLDFEEPHLPCIPAEPFASMYDPKKIPKWASFEESFLNKPYIQKQQLYSWKIENYTWEDWAPIVARYYAMISQLDDGIGILLSAIEELGIKENTMVIYTADHGDLCGGHRMMDKHNVMYDDIIKVPLIIRWPQRIEEGQACAHFVYNLLDLPPTILQCLDFEEESQFHGRSLLPLWLGEEVPDWRQEVVSTYNGGQFGANTIRMIRTKDWKYVWNTMAEDELYHLSSDPNELINLIYDTRHKNLIKEYRRKLHSILKEEGDTLVDNEWVKHQLLESSIY